MQEHYRCFRQAVKSGAVPCDYSTVIRNSTAFYSVAVAPSKHGPEFEYPGHYYAMNHVCTLGFLARVLAWSHVCTVRILRFCKHGAQKLESDDAGLSSGMSGFALLPCR